MCQGPRLVSGPALSAIIWVPISPGTPCPVNGAQRDLPYCRSHPGPQPPGPQLPFLRRALRAQSRCVTVHDATARLCRSEILLPHNYEFLEERGPCGLCYGPRGLLPPRGCPTPGGAVPFHITTLPASHPSWLLLTNTQPSHRQTHGSVRNQGQKKARLHRRLGVWTECRRHTHGQRLEAGVAGQPRQCPA